MSNNFVDSTCTDIWNASFVAGTQQMHCDVGADDINVNVNDEFIQRRVMKHLYCAVCTQW